MIHCGSIAKNNGQGQIVCVECGKVIRGPKRHVVDARDIADPWGCNTKGFGKLVKRKAERREGRDLCDNWEQDY